MTFGNTNSDGKFIPSKGYTEILDEKDAEIRRLRTALHTIFCNTEVDAIPHPSYDTLAQVICDTAAAALGYENGKPTLKQV